MTIAKDQLTSLIKRIEALEEEKKISADDIKDLYGEVKSAGFDPKAVKSIIKRRKNPEKHAEHEALVESYIETLGWDRTPLGSAKGEGAMVQ